MCFPFVIVNNNSNVFNNFTAGFWQRKCAYPPNLIHFIHRGNQKTLAGLWSVVSHFLLRQLFTKTFSQNISKKDCIRFFIRQKILWMEVGMLGSHFSRLVVGGLFG